MIYNDEYSIARYVLNRVIDNPGCGVQPRNILSWCEENSDNLLGFDLEEYWDVSNRRLTTRQMVARRRRGAVNTEETDTESDEETDKTEKPCRNLKTLQQLLTQCGISDVFATGADTGIDAIIRAFRLSGVPSRVFRILAYAEKYPVVGKMLAELGNRHFLHDLSIRQADLFATVCGVRRTELMDCLSNDGELYKSGILRVASDGDIEFYGCIRSLILRDYKTVIQIKKDLMGQVQHSELKAQDFSHVAQDYEYICSLLKCATTQHKSGINIMLYGAPGTGKTEFAKSVCDSIGVDLYSLDQSTSDRESRMSTLVRGTRLTRNDKNTVLLMDEAEDVFNSYEKRTSKLFLNQMLENNQNPTIWISNSISDMDTAFLRRFQYITEIRKPLESDRRDIWRKICDRYNMELTDEQIDDYVSRYDIAPSMIDSAISGVVLTGKMDSLSRTLDNMQIAIKGNTPSQSASNKNFMPELLNTDTDLTHLADCLANQGATRFSLCLYGAPGTGKSAYAVYLAQRLGLRCIHRRASDLKDKYVGETEKNIAQAFKEAADAHAVLVFDEADSFLQNREGANHSWEVSCVNEMLTQMERYPYPFICTTNLMEKLDPASLRRFAFKVKYDFMTPDQVKLAFRHFFEIELDDTPNNLNRLAPGDFVVVRNKCDILGIRDADEIIKMLTAEQNVKNANAGNRGNKIGF